MRHFFLDTNVLLDFMLEREPNSIYAQALFAAAEAGSVQIVVASLSFANIFYIARKEIGKDETLLRIKELLSRVAVLKVDKVVVQQAVDSDFIDFEDGLQYFCALQQEGLEAIVTRNAKDFKQSSILILSPKEAASSLL